MLPRIAIAVHLLTVLWWIGGLGFVTLVILPTLRRERIADCDKLLEQIESRFAPQARIAIGLVGISGGYLLWATGLWRVLDHLGFWYIDAMIAYWSLFVTILFVLEPTGLLQRVIFTGSSAETGWRRFHAVHAVLLALGVIVVGATAAIRL